MRSAGLPKIESNWRMEIDDYNEKAWMPVSVSDLGFATLPSPRLSLGTSHCDKGLRRVTLSLLS